MSERTLRSNCVEGTLAIGRRLGGALACGHVVALSGPLGAGKTLLVKGIAQGAGVLDPGQVNSPTFVIINEYETVEGRKGVPLRVFHIDAYRLRGGEDLEALGFEELTEEGAVVIEWSERVGHVLPEERLSVRIEPAGPTDRVFTCSAVGTPAEALLGAMSEER